jgi:2'-5' RNA ligase
MSLLRVFIALDTPPSVKRALVLLRDDIARRTHDVRWEASGKLHCTLQFLGDVEPSAIVPIERGIARAASVIPPFALSYSGVGFFPDRDRPRILWVGITDPGGNLERLQERISVSLSPLGFPRDERPFHPHVTLGRIKGTPAPGRLIDIVKTCTFEHPLVSVPAVEIMQSVLTPRGSEYTLLRSVPLAVAGHAPPEQS